MDGNRPRDDCRGEQEREGDEYPCVSKPRTIAALVGTHDFARSGASNLAICRWRSGSLIIRTQRSNRRVEARNLSPVRPLSISCLRRSAFSITARFPVWRTHPR
jgi:hypothetical protein